jgi:uncharacterized low-complexity protein
MSVNNTRSASRSTTAGMLGVALAGLVLGQSAFAMQPLAQGYMVAASHAAGEGKCGEGKCGADQAKSAKAKAAGKTAEGKCGEGKCGADAKAAGKTAEGKCGEGKCGASAKAANKTAEGKCGEGKCGDASFAKTDRSGDGRVSRAEFLAVAPTRAADFPKLDVDRDGFISEQEAYDYLKATYAANGKPMPAGVFAKFTGK